MTEQVRIDLVADDNASATIDDVADAAAKLEGDDVVLVIKAQIDAAKAELSKLDQQLKDIDDTSKRTGDNIGHNIEDGAGTAKGAVHGFVGEAVTELPGVGQALGPASEAVGQLTEGLLGGEVAMGELVAAAGALGGVLVVMKGITSALDAMKAEKAFRADLVKRYTTELGKAKSTAEVLLENLEKSSSIDFTATRIGLTGLHQETENLLPTLDALGLSVQDFLDLVAQRPSKDTVYALVRDQLGGTVEQYGNLFKAVEQYGTAADAANTATAITYEQQRRLQGAISETDRETRKLTGAMGGVTGSFEEATTAADEHVAAYQRLKNKYSDAEAFRSAKSAFEDFMRTVADSASTMQDVQVAADGAKESTVDYIESLDNLPDDVKTRLQVAVDEGSVEHARVVLDSLKIAQTTTLFIEPKLKAGTGTFRLGPDGEFIVSGNAAPTSTTVNVNLPRGYRGDPVAAAVGDTRRRGRRYGARSVRYARR